MSGTIGSEPVLIRMVGAVTVIRSSPSPTATVCGVDEARRAGDDRGGVLAVERLEVAGAEGAGQRPHPLDRVGEELLRLVLQAARVGVVHEHLGGHAADVRAGAAVHLFGLLDEDDALAGVGQRVRGGLAAFAESDDEDVGRECSRGVHVLSVRVQE